MISGRDSIPVDWLPEGEPFVEYRTRLDLLAQSGSDEAVKAARRGMLADSRVADLIDKLSNWPGTVIASHKSAGQPFRRLTFLADLGVSVEDPGVETIVAAILASFWTPSCGGVSRLRQ